MNPVLLVLSAILGAVVLIVALGLVIGFFLPAKYKISASIPIEKNGTVTANAAWKRLDDVEKYPMCGVMCRAVTVVKKEKGKPIEWDEDIGECLIKNEVTEFDEAARSCTRKMFDPNVNMWTTWNIQITDTQVNVDASYDVPSWKPLSSFVKLTLRFFAKKGITGYVASLLTSSNKPSNVKKSD